MAPGKQKYSLQQYVKSRITRSDQHGMPPKPQIAHDSDLVGIDLTFLPRHLRRDADAIGKPFDVGKPTCSINLLCHRNGILQKYQVQVISKDRCAGSGQFDRLVASNKRLIQTDIQFFKAVKRTYEKEMYGISRRLFSLKALREITLVWFTPFDSRPMPAFLPEYVKQDILFAYKYPEKLHSNSEWIQWVYNLRQPDRRYALEFIESWSSLRILIAVSVLLASSTALGITWAVVKDDAQTAFTVASFFLGAGSLLLAALAIVSGIEASTSSGSSQSLLLQDMNIHHTPAYIPARDFGQQQEQDETTQCKLVEQLNEQCLIEAYQKQDNTPTDYLIPKAEKNKAVCPCGSPGCNKAFMNRKYCRCHNLKPKTGFIIQGPDVTGQEDITPELGPINKDRATRWTENGGF